MLTMSIRMSSATCATADLVLSIAFLSMGSVVPTPSLADPVLLRFRSALADLYGDEIDRVVLFGSRARGDARPDSDWDVAVFLKSLPDRWVELDRLADLCGSFIDDANVFFDAKPYPAVAYQERTPLMREIRREGLTL